MNLSTIIARLRAKNFDECWSLPAEGRFNPEMNQRWAMINRHLHRINALYFGLPIAPGRFPGAKPHQSLWQYRQPHNIKQGGKA